MSTKTEACERKRQLLQDLLQAFSRVSEMGGTHAEIASQNAANDGALGRAVNEQQQAVIALENHQLEHGC